MTAPKETLEPGRDAGFGEQKEKPAKKKAPTTKKKAAEPAPDDEE